MFDLVVKPFISNGIPFERGTVITDPSLIRRYILKIREGKILQVDLDDEKSAYKFDILTQRYNLDVNSILESAGVIQPSVDEPAEELQLEELQLEEVDYDSMTPAQKGAHTKRMKKLAEQAAAQQAE